MMTAKYNCLLLVRISTIKQLQDSDSPEHQISRGLACAAKRYGYAKEEVFILTEAYSGRKEERPCLDQAFEMVSQYSIKTLLVYDIDRLTRAGAAHYELIKRQFKALGCDVVDVKGIIQPASNSLEGTGGTLGDDFTYDWSIFATSEKAEVMEAQAAKDEARKILSRTIPIQIKNAQLGRTVRPAPYGYTNIKIIDESGKPQPSKQIQEEEAFFVRKMFEGLASERDTRRICDELNQLGYRSRPVRRWNKGHNQVVGFIGGNPLTPAKLLKLSHRAIHAGFILEKWTHGFPVKANHEGIVSIDLWNAANKGYWRLIKSDASPTGWEMINTKQRLERRIYLQDRPDFPFKKLVICPQCQKPFKGSYSTGKMGQKFGYYHCNRGHKQVSISPKKLDALLVSYLGDLTFTPEIAEQFEKHIRKVWVEKVGGINKHLVSQNRELADMRDQTDALFEKVKLASSPLIIKRLEDEYETLQQRIKLLEANRDQKEYSETDQNRIIRWARHMVEHLDELILGTENDGLRSIFWALVFCTTPTLENLQNQTPDISPLVRLKGSLSGPKNPLASQRDFGSNSIEEELCRWGDLFEIAISDLAPIFSNKANTKARSLPQAA